MKRKLILLPITLTALTPAIGLVGCGNTDTPELETHIVTFSAGDHGSLEGETTVTIEGNKTTLGEITKPTVIADEESGWFFDHWDHDDSYVIQDDVTITALYQDLSEYTIDMDEIETIIGLEDVQFAQGEFKTSSFYLEMNFGYEFSPTTYHYLEESEESSYRREKYIYYDQSGQLKKQKRDAFEENWTVTDADYEESIETPSSALGPKLLNLYNRFKSSGKTLSFNKEKKCYEASWIEQETVFYSLNIEFYFKQEKLINLKFDIKDDGTLGLEQTTEATITYDEYTPELPIPPN